MPNTFYGEREWTMQRIADALNISQRTISEDLRNLEVPSKSKTAKTETNPKGAGRPKGIRSGKAPKPHYAEDEVVILYDRGLTNPEIAARTNLSKETVYEIVHDIELKRSVEPTITPEMLSMSMQQKV